MASIVFINCKKFPFVTEIMDYLKQYETRTRNTLGRFLGKRILIAETGKGRPLVRCSAVIDEIIAVYTREEWERYLELTWVPVGSSYDWQPDTKVKWLYHMTDIHPVEPFVPAKGRRHGRVWMEYNEEV